MKVSLSGKKALVVGATGGMGSAVASMLCDNGVNCVVLGRDKDKLNELEQSCSSGEVRFKSIISDISNIDSIRECSAEAIEYLEGLNFLIHCAGIYNKSTAGECDLEVWDDVLDTNLRSTYHFARHTLPEITKSPGGAVVRINSRDAVNTGIGIQTLQKRAIDGYMEVLFEDVREHGTKVCTINPGFVNTAMVNPERLIPERMIQPSDVSELIKFVLMTSATACPTEISLQPQRSPWKIQGRHI